MLLADAGPFEFHGKLRTGVFALNKQTGAIVGWRKHGLVGTHGLLKDEAGDRVLFAVHETTLYTYNINGAGNAAPTVYTLSATNMKTHPPLDWHPKLVSKGYANYGSDIIAASANHVFIG